MYAAFARLNYKPWYAIGEFVDNSLQSALANADALAAASGERYQLSVEIEADENHILVRDNAAGIAATDYPRAFLPASPPPDRTGLSEFGLGMKAAASWFAARWSVRTTALNESIERTIEFDIPHIVESNCDRLEPGERAAPAGDHYTELTLWDLNVHPKGRTVGKIKDHLRSIYRVFLRDGVMQLRVNGELLEYVAPTLLEAPPHNQPNAQPVTWRKEISLDLGEGHRVWGWAGILARASVTNAGFSIFRRRRLIQGSHGEGYRPEKVFGKPNKFVYQRLIGELEVEGFAVSHTKDGIQWEDWEDDILSWIRAELDSGPLRLLDQASNYRFRPAVNRDVLTEATRDTRNAIAQHLPPVFEGQIEREPSDEPLEEELDPLDQPQVARRERVQITLEHSRRRWTIELELVSSQPNDPWYAIAEQRSEGDSIHVQIRVNIAHPFLTRFISPDGDELIPFTRLAAALGIAEITAREIGVRQAGTIRMNADEILRNALSGPVQLGETGNAQQ